MFVLLIFIVLALAAPAAASTETVGELEVRVLTPPAYDETLKKPWPVLYVVPGSGLDASEAVTRMELEEYAARDQAIVVAVAQPGSEGENFITDYVDGTHRLETSFLADVLPWVESRYRTGRRGIAGWSAGGYSAAALAFRHPGTFDAVGSLSGVVDLEDLGPAGGYMILAPLILLSGPEYAFGIWGEPARDAASFRAHNPTAHASALKGTRALFLSAGSGRPASAAEAAAQGPGVGPTAYAETAVSRWTQNFHAALGTAGVPHTYVAHEGLHVDEHFRADFARFWPQAMKALKPQKKAGKRRR